MKLAILGVYSSVLALATEIASRSDLEIAYVCELNSAHSPEAAELLRAIAREAKPLDTWESLLDPDFVDGVIVCRGKNDELRSDQLRKFAQEKIPVLISHPAVDSMLLYYELDMIRRDTGAVIVPALADRHHPGVAELKGLIDAGENSKIGSVEQISIERQMADRGKPSVRTQFARDVDLIRALAGELNQIGAVGTSGEEGAYGNLSVQLTGPSGQLARWSVLPKESDQEFGRLVLTGAKGKAVLRMPVDTSTWTLSTGTTAEQSFPDWQPAKVTIDSFLNAMQGKPSVPDLVDAARCVELAETIPRSLLRRRTIELHYGEHSEENTFKGKMAVGGCVLLMLGLALLFFVAILDKANLPGARYWPWLLAVLFGGFSLLQLLSFAFKKQ